MAILATILYQRKYGTQTMDNLWGDEIPVNGEVTPLEHLAPELEDAVLDAARRLLEAGVDATLVARRIQAALEDVVHSVTRPPSRLAFKGGPHENQKRRANDGPGNGRSRLDVIREAIEVEEPGYGSDE